MKPDQRISTKEKLADENFHKQMYFYYSSLALPLINLQTANALYNAAVGTLDEADYAYVINPLNMTDDKYKAYPAKMRNYPLITNAVFTLLGEKSQRPINTIVAAVNSDLPNKQRDYEYSQMLNSLQTRFLMELESQGVPVDAERDEQGNIIPPKSPEVIRLEASNLPDEMAEMGQNFIAYANNAYDIHAKFRDNFFHFVTSGIVMDWKDVRNDELDFQAIKPIEMKAVKSRNVTYFEDCECLIRRFSMPLSECNDMFCNIPEYEDIKKNLESNLLMGFGAGNYSPAQLGFWFLTPKRDGTVVNSNNANEVVVEHICWTGEVKIGCIYHEDGTTTEVDETYEPTEFDNIEWKWVNQEWEGWVIQSTYYVGFQPIPLQRAKFNDPYKTKKQYNGRYFGSNILKMPSIVEMLMPYQFEYNRIHYLLEKIMNKHKDKMTLLPKGVIAETKDLDMFTTMYFADATGFLFVDESNPNALAALQHVRVLDVGLNQYIKFCYELLQLVKSEAEAIIGINAQRKGEINSSAGLGTTQEALYRGSIVSEELFKEFDEYQTRTYKAILDYSPFICANGKKASYVSSDFKRVYNEFYGEDLQQIEFNVTVKDSSEEKKNLEIYKQWAFNFTQNGLAPNISGRILEAKNLNEAIKKLDEYESLIGKQKQAQQEAENKVAADANQIEAEKAQNELDFKYYQVDENNMTSRLNKLEDVKMKLNGLDNKDDNLEYQRLNLQQQQLQHQIEKERNERIQQRLDREQKEKQHKKEIDVKHRAITNKSKKN
jgi:hypothetical protein